MKKNLITTMFTFAALIAAVVPVSAQVTDLEIREDAATQTAMATFRTDKDGRRISNSYMGDIVIPETSLSGYPVTAINHQTFEGCISLTSVTIPSSVKFIDYDAFRNSSLTEIVIPASVDSISEGAFFGMENLKKVIIEDGPSVLRFACGQQYGGEGQFSFKHQPIEEAYIGRTYTTTWGNDGSLDSPLFIKSETLKKVTFGDYVKKINKSDFTYCEALETVVFGSSIETIGEEAFYHCSSLSSINLPDGVKLIESNAFKGCTAAKTLILSNSLELISWGAFEDCKSVAEITIPASVDSISERVFFGMEQLKKVTIEDSPSVLRFAPGQEYGGEGQFSFKHQAIEEAYIGRTYTTTWGNDGSLDAPLFKMNETLKKVTFGNNVKKIYKYDFTYCEALETVVFGSGIESIGEEAFYHCTSLSAINLADGVKLIESNAFKGCTAAKTLVLSNSLEKIAWGAFEDCKSITEMTIPASVVTIEERAFIGMDGLQKLTIADGTTTLDISYAQLYGGENMFQRHPLTEAYIGRNVTSPEPLFWGNKTIRKVTYGDACTEIQDKWMKNCSELKEVYLGKNIVNVGNEAFYSCSALTSLTCLAVVPPICGANVFNNVDTHNCKLMVLETSIDAYKAADTWKDFFNIEPTGIKGIQAKGSEVKDSYSLNGQRTSSNYRGLTIQRSSDGKIRKVIFR